MTDLPPLQDLVGLAFVLVGVFVAGIAAVGIVRFPDVLTRMHAASKPQTFGMMLLMVGAALLSHSWAVAGGLFIVVMAQLLTITAASAMLGRAAFRRGFVEGIDYAVDELTPRLAEGREVDDDDDGFVDSDPQAGDVPGMDLSESLPRNTLAEETGAELAGLKEYYDEEEDDGSGPDSNPHPRTGEFHASQQSSHADNLQDKHH